MLPYLALWALVLGVFAAVSARYLASRRRSKGPNPDSPVPRSASLGDEKKGKSIYHANRDNAADPNFVPNPKPLLDFDPKTAKTRDYVYVNKTFRYPYYQTMAHQPLEIENWIEISSEYEWYLSEKKRVIEEQGTVVLDSLPENDAGCAELLETVIDFLPKRYPTLFDRLLSPSSQSSTATDGIYSHTTNERYTWPASSPPQGKDALQIISRLTECDFLMGREREDGHVYFVGGLVAFPGFYKLSEKIGKSMFDVHVPVPQFNEKLLVSVERTLKRMLPSAPFERSSWEIVDDKELFWHNIASLPEGEQVSCDPGDLYLRIDRQAFRKLPKTRAIIFAVHPLLRPLHTLSKSPLIPALLHKIHTDSARDLIKYKVADMYWDALGPWLEEKTREQIEEGLIGREEVEEGSRGVAEFRRYAKGERV